MIEKKDTEISLLREEKQEARRVGASTPSDDYKRKLLSSAYKGATQKHRNAWRSIITSETEEEIKSNPTRLAILRSYKLSVEALLSSQCHEIISH